LAKLVNIGKARFLFKDVPINGLPVDTAVTLAVDQENIGSSMMSFMITGAGKTQDWLQWTV
jgi:hypothetical protein